MDENEMKFIGEQIFKAALTEIMKAEETGDYHTRNAMTYSAVGAAMTLGYTAGFKFDKNEPGWPIAFIDLPTGQVSWHTPEYESEWDGHDNAEKFRRVVAYINA